MAGRRLSPEEREIWSRLAQTVHRLPGRVPVPEALSAPAPSPPETAAGKVRAANRKGPTKVEPAKPAPVQRVPVATLDDAWERRIVSGLIAPEMSVDLHGHTLEMAHRRLNQVLGQAVARGVRVLLVVTGNPRPAPTNPHGPRTRGAIRAEIGDWLALSGHSDAIASVRTAHPRHGGRGALYVILRRRK